MKDTRLSLSIVNEQADLIGRALAGGRIDFYSGTRPRWPEDAPEGDLLGSVPLADPAFLEAFEGEIHLLPTAAGVIYQEGRPTFARICTGDGSPVLDVSVGLSNVNIAFSDLDFAPGISIDLTSFAHRVARETDGV